MNKELIFERLNSLLSSNRHSELRGALMMLNIVDIAEFSETLEPDKLLIFFRLLPKGISSEVFAYMDKSTQQQLFEAIGDEDAGKLVEGMFIDDAVDFLEELPSDLVRDIIGNFPPAKRELINKFLSYPENSAGSIMTIEFASLKSVYTVEQALDALRTTGMGKETINTCCVVDESNKLVGLIELRKLIINEPDKCIADIMDKNLVTVLTSDHRENVARLVRKYDLISVPVVDKDNHIVGIVTVDDIMDVMVEENTKDLEIMSALTPSDDDYMDTSVWGLYQNRIPWLLLLMISATFTGLIISHYEDVLSNTGDIGIMLTACLPMLMATGGNSGSQSSTLIIRGIALGELTFSDIFHVMWREMRVALLCGVTLALVNVTRQMGVYLLTGEINSNSFKVTLIVSLAVFLTVVSAKTVGGMFPLLAKKLGMDPAVMASPIITTVIDAASLLILFSIASAIVL